MVPVSRKHKFPLKYTGFPEIPTRRREAQASSTIRLYKKTIIWNDNKSDKADVGTITVTTADPPNNYVYEGSFRPDNTVDPKDGENLTDKEKEKLKEKVDSEIAVLKVVEKQQNEKSEFKSLAPGFSHTLLPIDLRITAPQSVIAGVPVSFLAEATSPYLDSDIAVSSYRWQFDNGQSGCGQVAMTTFLKPGRYSLQVTAIGLAGAMATATQTITVMPPGQKVATAVVNGAQHQR